MNKNTTDKNNEALNLLKQINKSLKSIAESLKKPEIIKETPPETGFLELVDKVIFEGNPKTKSWTGCSLELERLLENSEWLFEFHKMRCQGRCGIYLSKLGVDHPDRISSQFKPGLKGGMRIWTIKSK